MRRRRIQTLACVVGCLVALGTPAALAQAAGQLTGVVRDTTGAVLPGVAVTVTGTALTSPRTVVTNELGRYQLENLPVGRYVVEATLSGFGPHAFGMAIDGAAATHDVELVVSSVSESVTVTATRTGAADIQSTPIAMTAFPARTIEELGIQTVEGLAGFAPTLTVSQNGGGRALITIRGIGSGPCAIPARAGISRSRRTARCPRPVQSPSVGRIAASPRVGVPYGLPFPTTLRHTSDPAPLFASATAPMR